METKDIITLWKKLGINHATFTFSCGGDSMNDTSIAFYNESDEEVEGETDELCTYFDNIVYDRVDFYVNSDGHYQGESGTVDIRLDDEEEDDFTYSKDSESEWCESLSSELIIDLTKEMVEFINENVSNINGAEGEMITVNFKRDFILNEKQVKLLEELKEKIENETVNYEPDNVEGELQDWFSYTTNQEGEDIKIDEFGGLKINMNNNETVYKSE